MDMHIPQSGVRMSANIIKRASIIITFPNTTRMQDVSQEDTGKTLRSKFPRISMTWSRMEMD
jgi:Ribonuclease G/E